MSKIHVFNLQSVSSIVFDGNAKEVTEVNIQNVFDTSKVVGGRHSGCIPFPEIPGLPTPFPQEDDYMNTVTCY